MNRGELGRGLSQTWDRLLAPMLRARRFEETLIANAPLINGVFHVSIGMEATAAALACLRSPDDVVMLNHRNHGPLVAIGSDPEQLYRELLGRDNAGARGRAGSLHLADPANGVPYTSAMLGGGVGIGAGLALAKLRRRVPGIVFVFFGDGAMGEGLLYETLNLAQGWQLPMVFVCESNGPAAAPGALAGLAGAHGVVAVLADGRRPRAALEEMTATVHAVRTGEGPRFVEAISEPWPGNATFLPHPMDTLDLARVTDPVTDPFDRADPVRHEARALLTEGIELPRLVALDAAVTVKIAVAFGQARDAPAAPGSVAADGVWGAT